MQPFGYAVLPAVWEWLRTKVPNRGRKAAHVIAELIAAKRPEQFSVLYVNLLEGDLKIPATAVLDEIEKVRAPHIKQFLNECHVGPARWNNLRDQIETLLRFAP